MQAIIGKAQRWFLVAALLMALTLVASPRAEAADQVVTGLNVIEIFYSLDGKKIDGGFRTFGGGQWEENNAQGKLKHNFTEVERRQWLVTLLDPKRNVYIYLDVGNQQVLLSYGNEQAFRFYWIVWSQAGNVQPAVNGLTIKEAGYTQDGVTLLGRFAKVGDDQWVEMNAGGQPIFSFVEYSRDNRTVVLRDYSRQLEVVLDLQVKAVNGRTPGQPFARFYSILWVK